MRYNIIKITDTKGRWFLMEIWTPSNWTRLKFWQGSTSDREGDWESLDQGFITVRKGDARRSKGARTINPVGLAKSVYSDADLWLGRPGANDSDPFIYGIILYDYDDARGTNSSGTGEVVQAWVLGLEPGKVSWSKASYHDLFEDGMRKAKQSP